ncbi:MAG: ATP-binding protein, partial [Trebonia sp.]
MHGGRLPAETTRFFGRSAETAAIRDALRRSRLVTLTGPGGVGKTRIAVRVARELSSAFPDGVYMMQLSALRDPELLVSTMADVLGITGQLARRQPEELVDYLRGKRVLLVLDTCEHLIDACAMFADMLLRGAEGPVLLATSRQALDIPGETMYPIPPLPVPDDGGDAVALFADRVSAAVPGFAITAEIRPKIVRLCRGLDGIPLAIELAAVRL